MSDEVLYRTDEEIESVMRRFESCEYQKEEFTHALHLTVAAGYLTESSPEQALERMRFALLRFTQYHGVKGYHETITRFWLRVVEKFLREADTRQPFPARVNDLIQRYRDKNLLFEYYRRELVMSDKARAEWVAPDLRAIED